MIISHGLLYKVFYPGLLHSEPLANPPMPVFSHSYYRRMYASMEEKPSACLAALLLVDLKITTCCYHRTNAQSLVFD